MAEIVLTEDGNRSRKNDDRVLYRDDVVADSELSPGAVVDLVDARKNYRGRGFYSDRGPVAVHVLSNRKVDVDREFFRDRVKRAIDLRDRVLDSRRSRRLVNSEGDLLPGLIVDAFGDYLSVQLRSQAMDRHLETIVSVLEELVSPLGIYHRADLSVRDSLGLTMDSERLSGDPIPDLVRIKNEPYQMVADLKQGQKTGSYLDQAENRRRLESLGDPGKGLDCFCYSGGWGLALLCAGADRMSFVDQSDRALELVRENLRLNGWEDQTELIESDGFDFLEAALESDRRFDSIVLDPPAFAKSGDELSRARAGYKGINFRAMRLLKPEGFLATSSCSHPMDMERFTDVIRESAHDAHVACQILERRYQSPDHPWLASDPRSRYLTCVMAEISLV